MSKAARAFGHKIDASIQARLNPKALNLWNHAAGPKTIHFWCPVMKWGLVAAGASDFARPAEKLSMKQNLSLALTGAIWTRYCFVIVPVNYFLGLCNFCLAIVGCVQVGRIVAYEQTKGNENLVKDSVE